MAFDKSLDETIESKTIEFETTKIIVSIMSYNKGKPKIQLSRLNIDKEGKDVFSKLGRLTKDEAIRIVEVMGELIQQME